MPRMYGRDDQPIPGYRLSEFLGRGGFGEVWKASAPGGTECAIKIINLGDKQGLKEFRAIRLVKRIHHPHLTPIIAFWLKDEQGNILEDAGEADSMWLKGQEAELIIAMGLGDKNLADRLKECRNEAKQGIPAEELLDYMEEAAKAIDFLNQPRHDLGSGPVAIQHCDIKPQNILIVGGSAQVCDFGLARQLNDARKTSMAAGTYAYIAPESIENKSSKTNDQYSLAISYVELRTSYLPFNANSLYEVMFAHLQGKLDFSRVTEAERPVLKRATAVNPEERFPTTLEMVKALRKAVEGKITSKPDVSLSGKSREMMRPGMEIVPGYKLVSFIGRGGYGEVWKAMAPGEKAVALKIIRHLEAAGGKQEFKALELLKSVDHNHLMEVHAYWLLDNTGTIIPDELRKQGDAPAASTMVIATKLASKNLLERLHECKRAQGGEGGIPLPELLGFMRQAADAIDYLNAPQHILGDRKVSIQHRDIKPENILLAANTVKVTDFGLAKVMEGASAVIHGDSAGLTLSYAAPEVFSNKVTSWSDQYSLAVTYFHLRTGTLPFRASAPTQIFMIHVEGKLDLSTLPEGERAVILRATSVEPSKRFPTCMAMVQALEEACGLTDTGMSIPTPWPDSKPIIAEKVPDTGRRVSPSGPKSTKPATSAPSDPTTPSSPSLPKTSPSLPSAPIGPKSVPSTPGSGRPSEGTKPSLSEPPPSSTPSPPAVKPEFNPYVTLTDPPITLPPASEIKQDTERGVPFEVDTDRPAPLEPVERTLEEINAEHTVKPWLPKEAEPKAAPAEPGWKKPVIPLPSTTPQAQTGASKKKIVKMVVAAFVVGALLGGGIFLISMLIPKPPVPPTLAAQIATLIEDGQYRAAYDKLQEHKADLTGKEIDDLHKKNAEAWLQSVRQEITGQRYRNADSALKGLLACYRPDEETGGLQQEIKQKLGRLKQLQDQLQQHITTKEWEKALAAAKEIDKDFPEEKEATQKSRDAAITYGIDSCRQQIDEASQIKNWSDACKQFESIYRVSKWIEGNDSKKASDLPKEVLEGWIKYGKRFSTSEAQSALEVANKVHDTAPEYPPTLAFLKEAKAVVGGQAELRDVNNLLKRFADAMDQGSAKEARASLAPLLAGINKLSKREHQTLKLNELAEKSEEVLKLPLQKHAPPAEVLTLVTALEEVTELKPATYEWSLAKALALAQLRRYKDLHNEFAKAKEAVSKKHPELLGEVLAAVTELGRSDDKIELADLTGILDEYMKLPKDQSSAAPRLNPGFCKLVENLVGRRLADPKDLSEYKELPAFCQAAWDTGQAEGLTRAYFAEHLLQANGELRPSLTPAELEKAHKATDKVNTAAKEDTYSLYVRGLVDVAEIDYSGAAKQFDAAGFRKPAKAPWQNWQNEPRRKLVATAYAKAADALAEKQADQAFEYYVSAIELNPLLKRDYARKLASSAYQTRHFDVCEKTTAELLPEDAKQLPDDAYQLALWNARSREELGKKEAAKKVAALSRYEEINLWRDEKKQCIKKVPVVLFYAEVLEPAIKIGEDVLKEKKEGTDSLKHRLAKLYAAKGKLILYDQYEEWEFKEPMREAAEAFSHAIDWHPDPRHKELADFYAQHGFALAALGPPLEMKRIEDDWTKALGINSNEPSGLALKGHYLRLRASSRPRFNPAKIQDLNDSNDAYDKAIANGKDRKFLSSCHADRSINYVLLANDLVGQKNEMLEELFKAEAEALLASTLDESSERAWLALGHAREDLALPTLGNQPGYNEKAEEAFQKAIKLHEASTEPHVALARLYIRWPHQNPGNKEQLLKNARTELENVLVNHREHPEANYWLGDLLWKTDKKQATTFLAKAIARPSEGLSWLPSVAKKVGDNLDAWEKFCKDILPTNPQEYGEAHILALYYRCQLRYGDPAARKADLKEDKPQLIADADEVIRLAKDPRIKLPAYSWAANARFDAMQGLSRDRASQYRADAVNNVIELLKLDPTQADWATSLANQGELYADDTRVPLEKRIRTLENAIKVFDEVIAKAPEAKQTSLREQRTKLRKKDKELEKKLKELEQAQ